MTNKEIVMKIAELVILLLEQNKPAESKAASDKMEMLTIGEAVKEFPGLTNVTVNTPPTAAIFDKITKVQRPVNLSKPLNLIVLFFAPQSNIPVITIFPYSP